MMTLPLGRRPAMANKEVWDEILGHLRSLDPKVKLIPCEDESHQDKTTAFVPVESVCYFSTDFDQKKRGYTMMVVADDGKRYFLNVEIGDIEEALADNPRFFRSGKFYLINVMKVRASQTSRARDLLFEGSDEWVPNAVASGEYLKDFQKLFLSHV
jgi:DNA-binding LytR/AlgR family response regulator